MIWDNAQIAIWDNAPNRDLRYTKLRFGTKFDLGPTYVPNQNVDLGHPKSEDRFGISQIVIWEIVGFGLQQIKYCGDLRINLIMFATNFQVSLPKENLNSSYYYPPC